MGQKHPEEPRDESYSEKDRERPDFLHHFEIEINALLDSTEIP